MLKNCRKYALPLMVLLSLTLLVTACGNNDAEAEIDEEEIVLRVNDRTITRQEYEEQLEEQKQMVGPQLEQVPEEQREMMEAQMEMSLQEQMKSRLVLLEAALDEGIEVTDEDVDEFADEHLQPGHLDQLVEQLGITEEELYDRLREDVAIERLISQKIDEDAEEITEEDMRQHFDMHQQRMEGPDGEVPEYEEVEDQIRMELEQQQEQEIIEQLLQPLMEEADIEENWPEVDMEEPVMPEAPPAEGPEGAPPIE